MSRSEAELTLVINARNLASRTVDQFSTSVGKLSSVAEASSARAGRAFSSLHEGITNGLGNVVETLASGGGAPEAAAVLGAYMAGQAAEQFIGHMLENFASSSLVAAIGGPLTAAGSALGGVISAAIPIGMALLPALLVAALVAAIAFLVTHPDVAAHIADVAGTILHGIVDGLATLGRLIVGAVVAAPGIVADIVGGFVGDLVDWFLGIPLKLAGLGLSIVTAIVGGLVSLPGKVADVVREAFANLHIDIGPFHISAAGVRIDLPNIEGAGIVTHNSERGDYSGGRGHAAGGWAGLHGPELSWLGEAGPEYVRRAGTGTGDEGGGRGVRLEGVSERELVDAVERGLYFRLRRAGPSGAV